MAAALRPAPPLVDFPLAAEFSDGRGGIWTAFDVDDRALITIVRRTVSGLDVVLVSDDPGDKSAFAVGDGGYRLHTAGPGVLVVASARPLTDLEPMIAASSTASSPLDDLARRVRASTPRADVRVRTHR